MLNLAATLCYDLMAGYCKIMKQRNFLFAEIVPLLNIVGYINLQFAATIYKTIITSYSQNNTSAKWSNHFVAISAKFSFFENSAKNTFLTKKKKNDKIMILNQKSLMTSNCVINIPMNIYKSARRFFPSNKELLVFPHPFNSMKCCSYTTKRLQREDSSIFSRGCKLNGALFPMKF